MLLIQGRDDEYGTLAQLDRIEARSKVPVSRLVLDRCGHAPHRDQEAAVIDAIVTFVRLWERDDLPDGGNVGQAIEAGVDVLERQGPALQAVDGQAPLLVEFDEDRHVALGHA